MYDEYDSTLRLRRRWPASAFMVFFPGDFAKVFFPVLGDLAGVFAMFRFRQRQNNYCMGRGREVTTIESTSGAGRVVIHPEIAWKRMSTRDERVGWSLAVAGEITRDTRLDLMQRNVSSGTQLVGGAASRNKLSEWPQATSGLWCGASPQPPGCHFRRKSRVAENSHEYLARTWPTGVWSHQVGVTGHAFSGLFAQFRMVLLPRAFTVSCGEMGRHLLCNSPRTRSFHFHHVWKEEWYEVEDVGEPVEEGRSPVPRGSDRPPYA